MKKTLLILLLFPLLVFSQNEKRLALVIGNANYDEEPLSNPVNDALLMKQTLESLNFDVILDTNIADRKSFIGKIREFGFKRPEYDVGFVYYAGHGIQIGSTNFLLPTKESTFKNKNDIIDYGVPVQHIMRYFTEITNGLNILVLDACRNNPYERNWNKTRSVNQGGGLAKISPPTGTLIAFSTEPGNTAEDGDGENSVYTKCLSDNMMLQNTSLDQVFRNVRSNVLKQTNGNQRPVELSQLTGAVYYLNNISLNEISLKINNHILENELEKALELSNLLVYKFPENSKGYAKRGHVYSLEGNISKAVENYLKAIEINQLEYEAYWLQVFKSDNNLIELGLETIYNHHYDPVFSINLLEKLKKIDKFNPCVYQEIARVRNWHMDEPKKALDELYYAIDSIQIEKYNDYKDRHYLFYSDKNLSIMASLLTNIAYVLENLEQYEDMISICKRAIKYELSEDKKSRNIGYMYNQISTGYSKLGKYEESLKYLNKAIKNIDSESEFYRRRALCYIKLDKLDLANKDFNLTVENSNNLYAKVNNLIFRIDFYLNVLDQPMRALFDLSEIIYILNSNNSIDFISEEEKNMFLAYAYEERGGVLKDLKYHRFSCEDYERACNLDYCYMYFQHCK